MTHRGLLPRCWPDNIMTTFLFYYWHDRRFASQVGGPMKVFELANSLVRLGHRVVLFAPRIGFPCQQTSARVIELPVPDCWGLRQLVFQFMLFWSAWYQGMRERPSLIYVRIMPSVVPLVIAKLFSRPLYLEVNDDPFVGSEHRGIRRVLDWSEAWMTRRYVQTADQVFPATHGIRQKLIALAGGDPERITVISSGANIDFCRPRKKEDCRRSIRLDQDVHYVGFLGTLFRHQGVQVLIESARIIVSDRTDTKFLIVGDGPERGVLEAHVQRLGLAEWFVFTGHVPYEQVPVYVGAMDFSVAPFLANRGETSPVKLFDTLACGRPAIASDIPSVRQVFGGTQCGVLFVPPEQPRALSDAIRTWLKDDRTVTAFGAAGRQFIVAQHNRTRLAQKVIDTCQC
jgi:glycosyltransferase involved in cell wall biosynthesis